MLPQPGFELDPGVYQVAAAAVLFCCPVQLLASCEQVYAAAKECCQFQQRKRVWKENELCSS